ncbi:hypothetical protein YPPY06_0704, partial [Yersinia pestis PY-06]
MSDSDHNRWAIAAFLKVRGLRG